MTIDELYRIISNLLNYFYCNNDCLTFYSTVIRKKKNSKTNEYALMYAIYMNYYYNHESEYYSAPKYIFKSIINP